MLTLQETSSQERTTNGFRLVSSVHYLDVIKNRRENSMCNYYKKFQEPLQKQVSSPEEFQV